MLLALPLLPSLPLLGLALFSGERFSYGGATFEHALANSVIVAVLVALGAFALGLPIGVLNAHYDYRCRRLLLTLALLPLLAPSFLWPLGWRWLLEHRGRSLLPLLSGYSGCVLMFLPGAATLVLFTAAAATAMLSRSQVEAVRLAGGEGTLFRLACRHAAVPAALAAVLAGILTLSDPSAGFAVGLRLASSEILISFAAFYDYALAGRQCLTLALLVLTAALPIAWLAAPCLVAERSRGSCSRPSAASILAWGEWPARPFRTGPDADAAALVGVDLAAAALERCGTCRQRPFSHGHEYLVVCCGRGFFAAGLGLAAAFFAGREERLRRLALGVSLTLFALPPMLLALGVAHGVAQMPAWTDPVLRVGWAFVWRWGCAFFP